MLMWFLASSPLLVLLTTMLGYKWKAAKAGFAAYVIALLVGGIVFGGGFQSLAYASAKGISLTLFVVLIIWTSVLLYQIVNQPGAVPAISRMMANLTRDELMLGLLISWGLTGIVQAVAGFGVPVAVCAPLMVAAGFNPLTAAVATLVGHSWAITFGSMGSSFYTLNLATGIPENILGNWVGLTFIMPTIGTGIAVAHIIQGNRGIKRSVATVVPTGLLMGLVQWLAAKWGLPQIAALLAGLAGVICIAMISPKPEEKQVLSGAEKKMVNLALTPYYVLGCLTLVSQITPVKRFFAPVKFAVSYPETVTALGFRVQVESAYAPIGLLSHPAPLILMSVIAGIIVYYRHGMISLKNVSSALKDTVKQCVPTTKGVLMMVMMALVMTDTGMTREMALGVANVAGVLFPVVSPFIGVLGCFMTGSNTNANVLFGAFQTETASAIGLSSTLMAGSNTCGASLGSSIAPTKVLLGSSTTGLVGNEGLVLKKCLPYCLAIVLVLGIQTMVATSYLNVVP
jgi:lactate permease